MQDIATEVLSLSLTSNFIINSSELVTSTSNNSYLREGEWPKSGVIVDGKIFIGNYTGNKWYAETVKSYHEEIGKARKGSPNPKNYGRGKSQTNNYNCSNYNSITKKRRTQKKIQRKIKQLQDRNRKNSDSVSSDESIKQAGTVFWGDNAKQSKNQKVNDGVGVSSTDI